MSDEYQKEIEFISENNYIYAIIIRASASPSATTFYTPSELNIQVGHVVYANQKTIPRHFHRPVNRKLVGTNEVLLVQKGICEFWIYNNENNLIGQGKLFVGDIILLNGGGHEFKAIGDLQLFEIKQGPYSDEKECF